MDKEIFLTEFGYLAQGPDGVKKLRDLILQLAVQGRLVEQDPNDEPARVLQKHIMSVKAELIEHKVHKKLKKLPKIEPNEIPFSIPDNWLWERLGNLTNYGETLKAENADIDDDNFWVLELEDIEKNTSTLLKRVPYSERNFKSTKNRFKAGDVLYGKLRPYLDKVLVAQEPGVCTTEIIPIKAYAGVDSYYLRWVMKSPSFIEYANNSTHGMNLPRMGTEKARLALFPLPPLAEQKRIVAKVDELMALCDELEASRETNAILKRDCVASTLHHLSEASDKDEIKSNWSIAENNFGKWFDDLETVENLRATILQLAVQGKLVEQDPNDEPASVLLEKIEIKKNHLIKEGVIKKTREVEELSGDNMPYMLPESWAYSRCVDICYKITDGDHATPKRSTKGHLLLSARNVTNEGIKIHDVDYVPTQEFERMRGRCDPNIGDILISCSGSIGRVALVDKDNTYVMVRSAAMIRPDNELLAVQYIAYALRSPFLQNQMKKRAKQSAQPNLFLREISSLCIPIPPDYEQKRIVAKVDELMALCDELEAQILSSQSLNQNLMASLCHHMTVN